MYSCALFVLTVKAICATGGVTSCCVRDTLFPTISTEWREREGHPRTIFASQKQEQVVVLCALTNINWRFQNQLLPITHPNYFVPSVAKDGLLLSPSSVERNQGQLPTSVPTLTHLFNSRQQLTHIASLVADIKKINFRNQHQYTMQEDDFKDVIESLHCFADAYGRH